MKLERYKDKKETRKKVILISLTVVTIVSVAMMLYKTFAKFTTTTSFQIMSGKVVYKKKGPDFGIDIPVVEEGTADGLYAVEHSEASGDWNQMEYRYVGANPNNYVYFNCSDLSAQNSNSCELWRIIGLVNVKLKSGIIEQRIKIIKKDSLGKYSWDRNSNGGQNDWTKAKLMGLLNDTYYYGRNDNTYCYGIGGQTTCNFSSGQIPKGLTSLAKDMIEGDSLTWNIGGSSDSNITAEQMYEKERDTTVISGKPTEWNVDTTKNPVTEKAEPGLFRGIGLMYASDYGFAVGGTVRGNCLMEYLSGYSSDCSGSDWLQSGTSISDIEWTLTPGADGTSNSYGIYGFGFVSAYTGNPNPSTVRPVVFLRSNVKIREGKGTSQIPYQLSE